VSLFPAVIILGEVAIVAVAIFGQTRYRTPLDVVLVILAAVGLDHLRAQRSKGPGRHVRSSRGSPGPRHTVDAVGPRAVPATGFDTGFETGSDTGFETGPEIEATPPPTPVIAELGGFTAAPD
jgi:hypothetical protein